MWVQQSGGNLKVGNITADALNIADFGSTVVTGSGSSWQIEFGGNSGNAIDGFTTQANAEAAEAQLLEAAGVTLVEVS
jgi:hypothetical protein